MNVSGVNTVLQPMPSQIQGAAIAVAVTSKTLSAQKAEGKAALSLIDSATVPVRGSEPGKGTIIDRLA